MGFVNQKTQTGKKKGMEGLPLYPDVPGLSWKALRLKLE